MSQWKSLCKRCQNACPNPVTQIHPGIISNLLALKGCYCTDFVKHPDIETSLHSKPRFLSMYSTIRMILVSSAAFLSMSHPRSPPGLCRNHSSSIWKRTSLGGPLGCWISMSRSCTTVNLKLRPKSFQVSGQRKSASFERSLSHNSPSSAVIANGKNHNYNKK